MNKSVLFSTISGITLIIGFVALIIFAVEMMDVPTWRMNGEYAKANALILNRVIFIGSMLISSYISLRISDVLAGNKAPTPAYDRTLEV